MKELLALQATEDSSAEVGVSGVTGNSGTWAGKAVITIAGRFRLSGFFFVVGLTRRIAGLAAAFCFAGFAFFVKVVRFSLAASARFAARLAALRASFQIFLALLNFCFAVLARLFAASASRAAMSAASRAACASAFLAGWRSANFVFRRVGAATVFFMALGLLVDRPTGRQLAAQVEIGFGEQVQVCRWEGERQGHKCYIFEVGESPLSVLDLAPQRQRHGDAN